jgi:hypothetical protein|nr:MAG TPA: hypothetical protein [Caudoviricetes sp.]
MKKHNMTIMDVYHTCYSLPPDIRVDVYSATKGALPLWSGELRTVPRVYREAIVDHMFIFADGSKINKLVFALKDQSLDYGKE